MLLRHVDVELSSEDFKLSVVVPFGFRARTLGNFMERQIRPLKFGADGFGKFLVRGRSPADQGPALGSSNSLIVSVPVDLEEYRRLDVGSDALFELYISMLCEGLERCRGKFELPFEAFGAAVDQFRAGGYQNEWCHQKKLFRAAGMHVYLMCSMDQKSFRLRLRVERKGEELFDREILKTKPDETIYKAKFKELKFGDGVIEVVNRWGEQLFVLPLGEIE